MDKVIKFLKRLPVYILILALAGYGIKQFTEKNKPPEALSDVIPTIPTQPPTQPDDPSSLLANVISPGGSFDIYPYYGDGHLQCRITGARVVQGAEDCPPKEMFEEWVDFREEDVDDTGYDDWFTENGAYSRGCRIILIDLEMTNVDFVGRVPEGPITSAAQGFFKDPYAFQPYMPIQLADLSRSYEVQGYRDFYEYQCEYFSELGKYGEDDFETLGSEHWAIQILPGETKTCTLGYLVEGTNGAPRDLSMLRAILDADSNTETGTFIELTFESKEG